MSLKAELQTWSNALEAYEKQDFDQCLDLFEVSSSLIVLWPSCLTRSTDKTIADSSKILFNIGLIQATVGAHHLAVQNFQQAINMDRYFSLAYFQSGVSHFLLGNYAFAREQFEEAYIVSSVSAVLAIQSANHFIALALAAPSFE